MISRKIHCFVVWVNLMNLKTTDCRKCNILNLKKWNSNLTMFLSFLEQLNTFLSVIIRSDLQRPQMFVARFLVGRVYEQVQKKYM